MREVVTDGNRIASRLRIISKELGDYGNFLSLDQWDIQHTFESSARVVPHLVDQCPIISCPGINDKMSFFARGEFQAADSKTQGNRARGPYELRTALLKLDSALPKNVKNRNPAVGTDGGGMTEEGGKIGLVPKAEKGSVVRIRHHASFLMPDVLELFFPKVLSVSLINGASPRTARSATATATAGGSSWLDRRQPGRSPAGFSGVPFSVPIQIDERIWPNGGKQVMLIRVKIEFRMAWQARGRSGKVI